MSSLYLHIPFCCRKCPYCDFYSQAGDPQQLADYVDLLCRDLRQLSKQHPDSAELKTIFFGGGTPSLLEARQVRRILELLRNEFGLEGDAEISLEANPGTLDGEKVEGYRAAGVNRLSLGVQSLRDEQLQLLGRIHSAEQAREAVALARGAGFANLNLDLMFNLPGQDCRALDEELRELLDLNPEHLSLYGLSFEEGTEFASRQQSGTLQPVAEEEAAAQYRLLHDRLQQAGFEHYEISNFARPGFRCRHNQVYWQRRACLAAGCGAHGFDAAGYGSRWAVPPDLDRYRQRLEKDENPAELLETFDRREAMAETLYLALRTSDGLSVGDFQERFGQSPEAIFRRQFLKLQPRLQRKNDRWCFDLDGWLLYDHLISQFF
jgi:oxygen-independent coproporphyrinogen-3 oxidase